MAALATFAGGTNEHTIVGIKVRIELNAQNGLRRVIFGLEKDTDGDEVVWKINFELFEREKDTDDYGDALVSLDIEVDTTLHNQAETAAKDGLTPGQAAHALGPAADDAKAASEGEIDEAEANDTVQATLQKK
jgi:hypothetical protein